jgi:hypothetical protein
MEKSAIVFGFPNGMICTCDERTGQQMPDYQGVAAEVWPGLIGRLNEAGYKQVTLKGVFPAPGSAQFASDDAVTRSVRRLMS